MSASDNATKKAGQRKRARASTGMEVLKNAYGKGNDSVTPLSALDLPDDSIESSIPVRSERGDTDPSSRMTKAAGTPPPSAQGLGGRYKATTNYFIPANLIRDWEYNDRTRESVLSDPKFPELKESIEAQGGLAEAIVVRALKGPDKQGYLFEQIVGCKRLTACKLIDDRFEVECAVRDMTDAEAAALQAAENKGRSDPPIWDRGIAWVGLLDSKTYGTVRELAAALGEKHEKTVANYVRYVRNIQAEKEFRTLPLSNMAAAPLELLANIAKPAGIPEPDREELVQRIVEIEDKIRANPDRAKKLIEAVTSEYWASKEAAAKPAKDQSSKKIYQSEHGKTMTVTRKDQEFRLVMHADIAGEIDHSEIESMVVDYLTKKGVHVKEKPTKS